jgi:8-oxo-dGTP pyrophosphatase MutT (NUDIX family)
MKIRGSVVVLEKNGKFLLQLRSNIEKIHHPNKWGLFGGHIENGETPIKAAIREIHEELELNLDEKSIKKNKRI